MTAHVVPRAKPYPETTATDEPAWEEEASTTVEPADDAPKPRPAPAARPNGNHTAHTQTGTGVEEHTVDEGSSPLNLARLQITGGNDAGQSLEIRPNKSYTVGRGLDNDIVLTDIAVSRKHFDLKFENGAWVIVDRGSGNGTVVNGTIEDNPFMLANGDTIEIGNTTFRFELPNGPPRVSQRTYELDDDEDMSTVAGKPLREDVPPVTSRAPDRLDERLPPHLLAEPPRPPRPKTVPPPIPPRALGPSVPPPLTLGSPPSLGPPPGPPLHLGAAPHSVPYNQQADAASTIPLPQMGNRQLVAHAGSTTMIGDAMGMPLQAPIASGPIGSVPSTIPGGQSAPSQRPSQFPYAQATDIPPHMLQIQTQPRRADGSTPHVAPAPYMAPAMMNPGYAQPQQRYAQPAIARRTKMIIAGVALALFTGVVTAAIVKSTTRKAPPVAKKDAGKVPATSQAKPTPKPPTATVTPINKTTVEPIVAPPPKAEPPKPEPPAQVVTATPPPKVEANVEPKVEPKVEPARTADTRRTPSRDVREPKREPKAEPKRVAVAADLSVARDRADTLYRGGKFSDAASVLAAAAKSADAADARELKDRANKLKALQSAYAKGTAPGEKATNAYASLQQAINLDASVGGNFKSELTDKLRVVAPKAAVAFVASKDWSSARSAYLAAQNAGANDSNLPLVKQKLEGYANELYTQAQQESASNPSSAKDKLKQIRQLVDSKSPIATKAQALYNKL